MATYTNAGLAALTTILNAATWYLAVGSGTTAEAVTQTALVTEITTGGLARASATSSRVTTTKTNDTLRLTKTWTASASNTINESGIFDTATTGGVMYVRDKLGTGRSVTSGDSFTATLDQIYAN